MTHNNLTARRRRRRQARKLGFTVVEAHNPKNDQFTVFGECVKLDANASKAAQAAFCAGMRLAQRRLCQAIGVHLATVEQAAWLGSLLTRLKQLDLRPLGLTLGSGWWSTTPLVELRAIISEVARLERLGTPAAGACDRCGGKTKRRDHVLCVPCGKAYSASLDLGSK